MKTTYPYGVKENSIYPHIHNFKNIKVYMAWRYWLVENYKYYNPDG